MEEKTNKQSMCYSEARVLVSSWADKNMREKAKKMRVITFRDKRRRRTI